MSQHPDRITSKYNRCQEIKVRTRQEDQDLHAKCLWLSDTGLYCLLLWQITHWIAEKCRDGLFFRIWEYCFKTYMMQKLLSCESRAVNVFLVGSIAELLFSSICISSTSESSCRLKALPEALGAVHSFHSLTRTLKILWKTAPPRRTEDSQRKAETFSVWILKRFVHNYFQNLSSSFLRSNKVSIQMMLQCRRE